MKRTVKFISALLVAVMLLSGCNVTENIEHTSNSENIITSSPSTEENPSDTYPGDDTENTETDNNSTQESPDSTTAGETTAEDLLDPKPDTDPYENVTKSDFYANYEEATSYWDAYFRTLHGFMSGSIEEQNQDPSISEYRPSENGVYLRNSSSYYSDEGNTYSIVNAYGEVVDEIYKGGAYVTLEEVAAYVFAFGETPANYIAKKSASPSSSEWGEYLRLNHSSFSGDTSRYPYEPALPDISGCGGSLQYYEIDIGTTGTDCDPKYDALPYNNGVKITRGAARIVYARFDRNGDKIIDINEKYVFYTNNHYNDFREYLNYLGGWGEIFGNITGGGKISSKTECNPTPYVPTLKKPFASATYSVFCGTDTVYVFYSEKYLWENLI